MALDFFSKKRIKIEICDYARFGLEKWYRFVAKIIGPMAMYNLLLMFSDGPNLNRVKSRSVCAANWWKDLLFINNFTKNPFDLVSGDKMREDGMLISNRNVFAVHCQSVYIIGDIPTPTDGSHIPHCSTLLTKTWIVFDSDCDTDHWIR